jgi:hypothetical protein
MAMVKRNRLVGTAPIGTALFPGIWQPIVPLEGPRSGTLVHSPLLLKHSISPSLESASWSYKEPLAFAGLLLLPDIP